MGLVQDAAIVFDAIAGSSAVEAACAVSPLITTGIAITGWALLAAVLVVVVRDIRSERRRCAADAAALAWRRTDPMAEPFGDMPAVPTRWQTHVRCDDGRPFRGGARD